MYRKNHHTSKFTRDLKLYITSFSKPNTRTCGTSLFNTLWEKSEKILFLNKEGYEVHNPCWI